MTIGAAVGLLLPVFIAIRVAMNQRPHCDWTVAKTKQQMWFSIFIIALSQLAVFTHAQLLSPIALVALVLEVFGVYRLTRAILRKRDLAKTRLSAGV